jgi:hypothetical protein
MQDMESLNSLGIEDEDLIDAQVSDKKELDKIVAKFGSNKR